MKKKLLPAIIEQNYEIVSGKVFYTNLYPDTFYENISEPVDVILSPEFYWIYKIENLGLSKNDALELAKNSFEFDDIENYLFYIFKVENFYLVFGIDRNLTIKIKDKYVNNIYLTQLEFFDYDSVKINSNFILKKINDIFYLIPKKINTKFININEVLKEIKLSKNNINIKRFTLNKKDFSFIILFLLVLNIYIFLNTYYYQKKLNIVENLKNNLSMKNNLPVSSLQLSAIQDNIKQKIQKKNQFFNDISYIFKVPLNKKEKEAFVKLNANYSNLLYDIKLLTKKTFHNYFNKKFKILEENKNDNFYYIKVKDE